MRSRPCARRSVMPEFAIFLEPSSGAAEFPAETVRAHCEHLDRLSREGRLIACGPFSDHTGEGVILGVFDSIELAREFASRDPFVQGGFRKASVRPWEWARPEGGFLGALPPRPGAHPWFLEALRLRATTRRFSSRPVTEDQVRCVLEAALTAPSEFNLQPWRPVVCHSRADRVRLQACCLDQPQVGEAGVAVVCAGDPAVFHDEAPRAVEEAIAAGRGSPQEREAQVAFVRSCYADTHDGALRNATIFGHQLLLAGFSMGLAGFWLGGLDAGRTRSEFGMPDRAVIAGVVGLGWPAEEPEPPMPRRPMAETVGWGRWP